jgi:hypothetical protein
MRRSKAIDAYNTAVKALRSTPVSFRPAAVAGADAPERSWESILKYYRGRNPQEGRQLAEAAAAARIRVSTAVDEDATARNDDEAWGRRMNREGQRRRNQQAPAATAPERRATLDAAETFEESCNRRRRDLLGR